MQHHICKSIANPIYFQFPIGLELELNWTWIGAAAILTSVRRKTRKVEFEKITENPERVV